MSGMQSCMGTISRLFRSRQILMVHPTCLSLGVAGSQLTWFFNPWWSPVTRYRCLTSSAAHIHLEGPAAVAYSKGSCTRVLMAYSGYRAAASSSVQLFGLAFGLGAGLACAGALRFFASGRRRALGCPCWGGCALGLVYRRVARCKYGVLAGGWDVGFGRRDGVLQLEHLLGHEAKHFLGLP